MPSPISSQPGRRLSNCWPRTLVPAYVVACLILLVSAAAAQKVPDGTTPQQSGMSTGAAHAPVKDALSRPITAGGFVDGAPVVFTNVTKQSGLDKLRHRSGT